MRSKSTSVGLWTRKALWPEGIKWRVFLLEPYPICAIQNLSVICLLTAPHQESQEKRFGRSFRSRLEVSSLCDPAMGVLHWLQVELSSNVKRTDGIAACPLNRLLTRLSIPFGFLHAASTHLYVSLWWRLKRFVPNILRKLSKILSSQATQNLAEGDRGRCEWEECFAALKFLHTLLHYLYVLLCWSHLCAVTSISRISTSRNGRVLHTLLRCVVELTISATTNNSNSLRSGNVVYIKLALALSESVSERNAPYWAVTTEVLRFISVQYGVQSWPRYQA